MKKSKAPIAAVDDHLPQTTVGIARHYLKDMIYGANDGIVTTFAIVAGVAGANLSVSTALILGIANLLADGFSMGASNYLALSSEDAARCEEGRPVAEPYPMRHGIATFLAFVAAGSVPLLAFVLQISQPFLAALVLTALALFAVGAARSLVVSRCWWRAGIEMLVVGTTASAIAYLLGRFCDALLKSYS